MTLSDQQKALLARHWALLSRANVDFNLTAIIDDAAARDKHYQDCLSLPPLLAGVASGARLLDIGSGGGFPGLIIAVLRPDIDVCLLDATRKKCDFLSRCADELGLANVRVLHLRAEEAGRDPDLRDSFDVVTARAVAGLSILLELALPLLRQDGRLLAMKGEAWAEELAAAANALSLLGGQAEAPHLYALAGGDKRAILTVRKAAATPDKYPRRPGMPNKRPL